MNVPLWPLPHPSSSDALTKKKRVLLLDSSRSKRDLRSETMRKLGAEVDCAADVAEARCWWRANLYDLVLIQMDEAAGSRDKFCDDIRKTMPHQQIMFLVGKPEYLAAAPNSDPDQSLAMDDAPGSNGHLKTAVAGNGSNDGSQRWGILEACRQISAVRSVADARTRAIQGRPIPKRDSETTRTPRADQPRSLAELIREEMQ
jgi:CheY-like chemotaxis protein